MSNRRPSYSAKNTSATANLPPFLQAALAQPPAILILSAVGVGIILIGVLMLVFGGKETTPPPAGLRPFPLTTVDEVIGYYQRVGLKLTNLQPHTVNGLKPKTARKGLFTEGGKTYEVIVMGYDSSEAAYDDEFTVKRADAFKTWHPTAVSNIVVLTPKTLRSDVSVLFWSALHDHLKTKR
ncbi:MAG TPA: hypothetical protein PLD47_16130 [Aggregatilineales bacterium]|nr:hypothetical protein [Anaerolineales bacterium]HRE49255.1 hypothetical protein [Aggregatilineales bacterium]